MFSGTLRAAAAGPEADAETYQATPPAPDEFSSDDDSLAWEADGDLTLEDILART